MAALVDRPLLMLVVSFVALLVAALIGVAAEKAWNPVKASDHNELAIVQSAALTLLAAARPTLSRSAAFSTASIR